MRVPGGGARRRPAGSIAPKTDLAKRPFTGAQSAAVDWKFVSNKNIVVTRLMERANTMKIKSIIGFLAFAGVVASAAFSGDANASAHYCLFGYAAPNNSTVHYASCNDGSNYVYNLPWMVLNPGGGWPGETDAWIQSSVVSNGGWYEESVVQCTNGQVYYSPWIYQSAYIETCPGINATQGLINLYVN